MKAISTNATTYLIEDPTLRVSTGDQVIDPVIEMKYGMTNAPQDIYIKAIGKDGSLFDKKFKVWFRYCIDNPVPLSVNTIVQPDEIEAQPILWANLTSYFNITYSHQPACNGTNFTLEYVAEDYPLGWPVSLDTTNTLLKIETAYIGTFVFKLRLVFPNTLYFDYQEVSQKIINICAQEDLQPV